MSESEAHCLVLNTLPREDSVSLCLKIYVWTHLSNVSVVQCRISTLVLIPLTRCVATRDGTPDTRGWD